MIKRVVHCILASVFSVFNVFSVFSVFSVFRPVVYCAMFCVHQVTFLQTEKDSWSDQVQFVLTRFVTGQDTADWMDTMPASMVDKVDMYCAPGFAGYPWYTPTNGKCTSIDMYDVQYFVVDIYCT